MIIIIIMIIMDAARAKSFLFGGFHPGGVLFGVSAVTVVASKIEPHCYIITMFICYY